MKGSTKGGDFYSIPENREEAILLMSASALGSSMSRMNPDGWEACFRFGVFCCERCKDDWLSGNKMDPGVEALVLSAQRPPR
jgi:hypothetical protein